MKALPTRADAAPQEPHAPDPLVARYLDYVRVEKRLAQRTVELYTADLQKLQANARKADVALTQVKHTHLRRWVAQMHSSGWAAKGWCRAIRCRTCVRPKSPSRCPKR